jgi:hypothetical protein
VGVTLNNIFRPQNGAKGNKGSFYSTTSNRKKTVIAGQNSTGGFFLKQSDQPTE